MIRKSTTFNHKRSNENVFIYFLVATRNISDPNPGRYGEI
jgi:hypothetical protein